MSNFDLNRVRADLAILKEACAEPAIPVEEIAYIPSTSNHSLQRLPLTYAKR